MSCLGDVAHGGDGGFVHFLAESLQGRYDVRRASAELVQGDFGRTFSIEMGLARRIPCQAGFLGQGAEDSFQEAAADLNMEGKPDDNSMPVHHRRGIGAEHLDSVNVIGLAGIAATKGFWLVLSLCHIV